MKRSELSEDARTIIGTNSRISIALIAILISPLIWLLSLTYELRADIAGLRAELAYIRLNSWTISDMEHYRFQMQMLNGTIGLKTPEVGDIVSKRPR